MSVHYWNMPDTEPLTPEEEASRAAFYEAVLKDCHCCDGCSTDRPCAGVCAGGLCHGMCYCRDRDDDDRDEGDDNADE